MDDLKRERDRLERELQRASEAFEREYKSIAHAWGGRLGPFTVRTTISGEAITALYVVFNVICFAVGVAFILLNGVLQTLGISLVVGGLFSAGTFMAQWWDHAWQRQHAAIDHAYGEKQYAELRRLANECEELYEKLKGLPEPSDQ